MPRPPRKRPETSAGRAGPETPPPVFVAASAGSVPLRVLSPDAARAHLRAASPGERAQLATAGFAAAPGAFAPVIGRDGRLSHVVAVFDDDDPLYGLAALATRLPDAAYAIAAPSFDPARREALALGLALASYRFRRYKTARDTSARPRFVWPAGIDRARVGRLSRAVTLVRDLVNAPASDMGPEALADAALDVARRHKATGRVIVGDDLLAANYPAVYAVGMGSARAPRLIDITWGDARHPKVTLVGKGVCFDSGGLNLKPENAMKLMKKDMAGAAHALALADAVMDAGLGVRLRVLVPAVENSVSGRAMRPLDVISTRKGLTVEIGHTDAEGRLILADALAEACAEKPDLLIDWATLTGAARTALGTDIAALFSNRDDLAEEMMAAGRAVSDPLWRLPLWPGYRNEIEGKTADLSNVGGGPYAGAIVAGLFLERFVTPATPWAHIDMMAWNLSSRPGRPEGGEALSLRAVYRLLETRYPPAPATSGKRATRR